MADPTREQMRQYVRTLEESRPLLDAIRVREIRETDTWQAILMFGRSISHRTSRAAGAHDVGVGGVAEVHDEMARPWLICCMPRVVEAAGEP